MAEPTHVYIGRVPGCGCIEAFYVDTPDDPKRVGKNVGEMVKSGYEVSRVLISDDIRLNRCTHEPAEAKQVEAAATLF
jgi:hypothetical protein